jgi:hypothetical protein
LAVAERPGGGGRTHRRAAREAEQAWWRARGVRAVVSGMVSRHGLVEYALDGLAVRWHPLTSPERADQEVPELVAAVLGTMAAGPGAVLVHVNHANEWLAGVDAALRLSLRLANTPEEALAQAAADGFPVGPLAATLAAAPVARGAGGARSRPATRSVL